MKSTTVAASIFPIMLITFSSLAKGEDHGRWYICDGKYKSFSPCGGNCTPLERINGQTLYTPNTNCIYATNAIAILPLQGEACNAPNGGGYCTDIGKLQSTLWTGYDCISSSGYCSVINAPTTQSIKIVCPYNCDG